MHPHTVTTERTSRPLHSDTTKDRTLNTWSSWAPPQRNGTTCTEPSHENVAHNLILDWMNVGLVSRFLRNLPGKMSQRKQTHVRRQNVTQKVVFIWCFSQPLATTMCLCACSEWFVELNFMSRRFVFLSSDHNWMLSSNPFPFHHAFVTGHLAKTETNTKEKVLRVDLLF